MFRHPYRISQQSHVSWSAPMYRPVGNPPPTPLIVLKLIIGPRWIFPIQMNKLKKHQFRT